MRNCRSAGAIVGSIAIVFAAVTGRAQSNRVPVPSVGGPLSVTPQSYPFAAADHQMTAFDLAGAGYVEEEFLVSGTANVYDWQADR